jgi:glycosyltransferase involved in cell wall biosynthesis
VDFLKSERPDILHIQYQAAAYDLGGWVNWFPWRLDKTDPDRPRTVDTFHDLRVPYLFPKAGRLRWQSILGLARYSDAAITTNAEDEHTLRQYPWAGHVQRIPLGSNVETQTPAGYDRRRWRKEQWGVADDNPVLAYFGFLNQSKGGLELVAGLDNLTRRGYNPKLVMIGGQVGDVDPTNAAYADQVHAQIGERGLEDRVVWTGHTSLEEVSANLLAADVVVMPYRDGVSFRRTTFIAALSHGRPVVTSQPAYPLAELRDGENVVLAPAGDVDALTDAIARLLDSAPLRARLGGQARLLAKEFEWPIIAGRTELVYRELVASR